MMNDCSQLEIVKILTKRHPEVSAGSCRRYYYLACAALEEKCVKSRTRKIAGYVARKRRALRDMDPAEKRTAQGVMAISRVIDSIAELEGISTRSLAIKGDADNPVVIEQHNTNYIIDYSVMPTEMLEYLLKAGRTENELPEGTVTIVKE